MSADGLGRMSADALGRMSEDGLGPMSADGLGRMRTDSLVTVKYRVGESTVAGAGKGFFVEQDVSAGRVLIAPTNVDRTVRLSEILSPESHPLAHTSIVWFEDHCTVSPEWCDDCYINHSFRPNGLWHLGFVFALEDVAAGDELFLDYRHLLAPGYVAEFRDGVTGAEIVGYDWKTSLRLAAASLSRLAERL